MSYKLVFYQSFQYPYLTETHFQTEICFESFTQKKSFSHDRNFCICTVSENTCFVIGRFWVNTLR